VREWLLAPGSIVLGMALLSGCVDEVSLEQRTSDNGRADTDPTTEQVDPGDDVDQVEQDTSTLFDSSRVVEVRIELATADWDAMLADPRAEEYHPADLIFDGTTVSNVAVRTKGNSSLNSVAQTGSHRFSFKLDLNKYVSGTSLHGQKKFVLNNGFKDASLMQEHLAYRLMRDFGVPAPRTAFVDLWVGGEHMGLYTLVEAVDGDFVDDHFAIADGDSYKPEVGTGELRDQGDDITAYRQLEPESNQDTTDHGAFLALIRAINRGESLTAALDVAEAIDYLAVSTALVNLDSYQGMGHNYYLYEQESVFTVIPWDLNEAFGTFNCGCGIDGLIGFFVDEPTCGPLAERPLIPRLFEVAGLDAYHARLQQLIDTLFSAAALASQIDQVAQLIRPYVEADPTKFASLAYFDARVGTDDAARANPGTLIGFVAARAAAIRSQLAGSQAATNGGQGNCGGTNPGPGLPPCSQAADCAANTICAPMGFCVPDCRSAGCPQTTWTCDQSSGLCATN